MFAHYLRSSNSQNKCEKSVEMQQLAVYSIEKRASRISNEAIEKKNKKRERKYSAFQSLAIYRTSLILDLRLIILWV